MPVSEYDLPGHDLRVEEYRFRRRVWSNTAGYSEVPRRDLPVNPYNDYQYVDVGQTARSESYFVNRNNGVKEVVSGPGFLFSGNDIRQMYEAFEVFCRPQWQPMAGPAYDDAVVKLLNKAADLKTNLAVTLAEAHKTADLILSSATRYVKAFRAFRKGRLGEVASLLQINPKAAHKSWLEYKYGWIPLLMDVKNTAELFAQVQLGGRPPRFTVKQKYLVIGGSKPLTIRRETRYHTYGGEGGDNSSYYEFYTPVAVGSLQMTLEVIWPEATLAQQVGLTNPALVVWELVPYSFVFDWFVSVGDWLSAMTALQGLRVYRPCHGFSTAEMYYYVQPETHRVFEHSIFHNAEFLFRFGKREYNRSHWIVPELPRIPSKFDLGFARMTTSLALLRSNNRSSRTTRV